MWFFDYDGGSVHIREILQLLRGETETKDGKLTGLLWIEFKIMTTLEEFELIEGWSELVAALTKNGTRVVKK